MPCHPPAQVVKGVYTSRGRNPESALTILQREPGVVAAQTVRIARIVVIMGETQRARIQAIQSIAGGEPHHSISVLGYVLHVSGRAPRVAGAGVEVGKHLCDGVKSVQALTDTDPQHSGAVLKQRVDRDPAQAVGVVGLGFVDLKAIAVETIQAVVCAEPQEPLVVLQHVIDTALRESFFRRIMSEADVLPVDQR